MSSKVPRNGQQKGKKMDPSDGLLAARDALREHGWWQGALMNEEGRVCLRGAIHVAFGCLSMNGSTPDLFFAEFNNGRRGTLDALDTYCYEFYGQEGTGVNDSLLESEDQAAEVLESASKWAAQQKKGG